MNSLVKGSSRRVVLQYAASTLAAVSLGSRAQSTWPSKPVNLVVPFPAGGGTDAFARPLSAQFAKLTGRQMVIDNRGGAGGTLGAGVAAKAAPDGYTLFMGAVHHAIAPSMYAKLDYDIEKDFVPLALVANVPQVLVVNPKNQPGDFKEFLERVRKAPGRYNYGSAGGGTSHHLAGELFKQQSKTFITHIPYRGAGPALQDLIGGQIDIMFDNLPAALPHIRSGRVRALAVTTLQRTPSAPELPTLNESGVKGFDSQGWFALLAPTGTPQPVLEKINAEVNRILATPEFRERLKKVGADPVGGSISDFRERLRSETERWGKVIKFANITAE